MSIKRYQNYIFNDFEIIIEFPKQIVNNRNFYYKKIVIIFFIHKNVHILKIVFPVRNFLLI